MAPLGICWAEGRGGEYVLAGPRKASLVVDLEVLDQSGGKDCELGRSGRYGGTRTHNMGALGAPAKPGRLVLAHGWEDSQELGNNVAPH